MADNVERYRELQKKRDLLNNQKIRLDEQYKAKKQALTEIIDKIRALGIEPNKLKEVISEKESALKLKLNTFERDIEDVSKKLSAIQG
jgi:mannitol/fructose-specific phosphotransferase system IIA component (Ntr-type)